MEGNTQSSSLWQDDDDQEFVDNDKLIAGIQPVQRCLDDISVAKGSQEGLYNYYKLNTRIGGEPEWLRASKKCKVKEEDDEEDDDEEDQESEYALRDISRTAANYIAKPKYLPRKYLMSKLLRDVTIGHQGALTDLKFHPYKPVLVTANSAGVMSLFEVCTEVDPLTVKNNNFFLQDVRLEKFPISSINFYNKGLCILASSNGQGTCFCYDMMDGKVVRLKEPITLRECHSEKVKLSSDGTFIGYMTDGCDVFVYEFNTMELISRFRSIDKLVDFTFSSLDRNILYGLAENGAIQIWDIARPNEQFCFFDDGCVKATCLGNSNQFISCGSNTGIVNVYDLNTINECSNKSPPPTFTLDNLTTAVAFTTFSQDSQLMSFGSSTKYMAGRMLHCSSGDVFQNFPQRQEMLSKDKLVCAAFSPCNAFFTFGTQRGKCRLYRLDYFSHY